MTETESEITETNPITGLGLVRSAAAGVLMGLANLVPGISGGTMLLAVGIYPRFIEAISDITRFRFRWGSIVILVVVIVAAALAILLGAGVLKDLVVHHRWIMYSLFIGLTLGGIPVVSNLAGSFDSRFVFAAVLACGLMVALAVLQEMNVVGSSNSNFLMLFLAGIAGASAMILPGVSGGYILLLMGQYVPILSGIDQFKDAIAERSFSAAMEPLVSVMLPVGIGVVVGVMLVGNLIGWLLHRYRKATLGFLLGLLIGSVVGLWPFRVGVEPEVGDRIKGQIVTRNNVDHFDPEDWPTVTFTPGGQQLGVSLGLIVMGFVITFGVSKIGGVDNTD